MRVALADDSALFRRGLGLLLEAAGADVVVSVGSGLELQAALRDPAEPAVDVAVLDIRMPPTFTDEGLTTAEALRRGRPGLGVLLLSTYVEAAWAIRLLQDDGHGLGYLLKDRVDDVPTLVAALERIGRGENVVDPEVVSRLVQRPRQDPLQRLSAREHEVLALLAQGSSNSAIAAHLHLSEKTVEGHVAATFDKLGLPPQPHQNRRVLAVLRYLQAPPRAQV
jgi:DNA-binding NarL/FixJ family response regulator